MSPVKRRPKARKIKGEGWELYAIEYGQYRIERIDDPSATLPMGDPRLQTDLLPDPAFANDAEAIAHVIKRAKAGDEEAIDALWSALDCDALVNELFWRMK